MQYMNNCLCGPYFFILLLVIQILCKVFCPTETFFPPHSTLKHPILLLRQFTYLFASKSHICDYASFISVDNRRMKEKGPLTLTTICSFLNWNLGKGAVSTAQQNQPVITEKGKNKSMQNRKWKICLFLLSGDPVIHLKVWILPLKHEDQDQWYSSTAQVKTNTSVL